MKENPTPKRKQVQKLKSKPLIISNIDKGSQKIEQKRRLEEIKQKRRNALETGDEKYLPPRDQGPVKRTTRNFIDSHTSISEFFMPIALLVIVLFYVTTGFLKNNLLATGVVLFMYVFILVMIIDSVIKGFQLKHYLINEKKYQKNQIPRGTIWYGISRSFQFRRLRLPKPQVKRGELF
jgi:hypothetical protein